MSAPDPRALVPPDPVPGGPVFTEAWHAEALGVANVLAANGLFSAAEWTDALGRALKDAAAGGRPDTEATYYAAVLAALERLVAVKAPETGAALDSRAEAWRRAYRNTPHGKPVELAAADHDHGGEDHRQHDHGHHHDDHPA